MAIRWAIGHASGDVETLRLPVTVWDDTFATMQTADAILKAEQVAPATVFGNPQTGKPGFTEVAPHIVKVDIHYAVPSANPPTAPAPPESGTLTREASFQAKSETVYNALQPIIVLDSSGDVTADWPHTKWKVDLQRNSTGKMQAPGRVIEPLPETRTLNYFVPNTLITEAYLDELEALCGKFNDAEYRGIPQGSLQFVRFSASERSTDDWQLSFGFGKRLPKTELQIAQHITLPELRASWIYWTVDKERYTESTGILELEVELAVVQRVWEEDDFAKLDLPPLPSEG